MRQTATIFAPALKIAGPSYVERMRVVQVPALGADNLGLYQPNLGDPAPAAPAPGVDLSSIFSTLTSNPAYLAAAVFGAYWIFFRRHRRR